MKLKKPFKKMHNCYLIKGPRESQLGLVLFGLNSMIVLCLHDVASNKIILRFRSIYDFIILKLVIQSENRMAREGKKVEVRRRDEEVESGTRRRNCTRRGPQDLNYVKADRLVHMNPINGVSVDQTRASCPGLPWPALPGPAPPARHKSILPPRLLRPTARLSVLISTLVATVAIKPCTCIP